MIGKNETWLPFLSAILLTFLLACGQSNASKNITPADIPTTMEQPFTIDTFSTFPPEIEGCSCYFSNDSAEFKKRAYVYMNDYAQTSFLKINGVLTSFTLTDSKQVSETKTITKAKSDNYEMTMEVIDSIQNGDETWLKTGTIRLTDKAGKTITKPFYGECGC